MNELNIEEQYEYALFNYQVALKELKRLEREVGERYAREAASSAMDWDGCEYNDYGAATHGE